MGFFGVFFAILGFFWGFLCSIFNLVGEKSPINQILAYNVSNRLRADFRELEVIQPEAGDDLTLIIDGEVQLKENNKYF